MEEKYTHINHGTCSTSIDITVEGDMIKHVQINDGCRGNTQGVSRLAENRPIDEVIALCDGIQCRGGTSCPDQLAKALKEIKAKRSA